MPTPPKPGPLSEPTASAVARGMQAARRLQALHAKDLPRLRELRERLRMHAHAWCGSALALTLKAHAGAAAALRFDLLVAPGLRAGPKRHDEEAFRRQVEDVSTCTEVTWLQVRDALVQDPGADTLDPAALDFVMASRAFQHEVAQAARTVADLREQLEAGPGGAGTTAVLERLRETTVLLEPLGRACESAHAVQKAAWRGADRQRELQAALHELARVLRGGLLARLGALLAPDTVPGASDLAEAGTARDALVACLGQALQGVEAMRVAQDELLTALEGMAG